MKSRYPIYATMPGRMPFTLNTMVLLPLLRSLPVSGAVSVVAALTAMIGLDFGVMGLGHPETAADDLVAWMIAFNVAVPLFWGIYVVSNAWAWATQWLQRS